MIVLGLTGGFHFGSCDAAAAIVRDGKLVAHVEEERISRMKNSFSIPPTRCIRSALDVAGIGIRDVAAVALYIEGYPEAKREMKRHIESLFGYCPPLEGVNHHLCHAASAYYASGWDEGAVVTFDWSGDGVSTSIWKARGRELELVQAIKRPNSLGCYYAAFTQFLGFERGDEYKVMGLASYGEPDYDIDPVLDISDEVYQFDISIMDPSNRNMNQLVFTEKLDKLFPDLRRARYDKIGREHINLAASVQRQFERATANLAKRAVRLTGIDRLCIAGGGGLNCTSNGKLVNNGVVKEVYLPPFPNDTGCAFGGAAALSVRAGYGIAPLTTSQLGPAWTNEQIKADLDLLHCKATFEPNIQERVADALVDGKLVGWYQGGLEVGPRALGGRSILADPRERSVKERINTYVKFREDFRPFAPSVLVEDAPTYFDFEQPSPFMSFIAPVKVPEQLAGITHVDGTARLQTVHDREGIYGRLLTAMKERTGYSVVLNTSFNYMGQPIVCTPKEAVYTFFGTGLDVLALGNWLIQK